MKTKTVRVKINIPLKGKKAGSIFLVEFNDKDLPVDRYWRRRFEEAKSNNCVEIVKNKQSKPKTQTQKITTLED